MRDIVSHICNSNHWKHRASIADQKFLSSSSHAVRMMSLEGPFQVDTLTFREKRTTIWILLYVMMVVTVTLTGLGIM